MIIFCRLASSLSPLAADTGIILTIFYFLARGKYKIRNHVPSRQEVVKAGLFVVV